MWKTTKNKHDETTDQHTSGFFSTTLECTLESPGNSIIFYQIVRNITRLFAARGALTSTSALEALIAHNRVDRTTVSVVPLKNLPCRRAGRGLCVFHVPHTN